MPVCTNKLRFTTQLKGELNQLSLNAIAVCVDEVKSHHGWVFLCGDAYYSNLQLNPKNELRTLGKLQRLCGDDHAMRSGNLHKIQKFAQTVPTIEIMCAHDSIELARYLP